MQMNNWRYEHFIPKNVRKKQLQAWLEQIQLYLSMGYSFIESLKHIKQTELPKSIHNSILYDMSHGKPIHECFKKHKLYFDDVWIDILAQSSNIPLLMQSWITQVNSENTLHKQLQQQLFYPSILCAFGVIFLIFFKYFIYPQYETLYAQFNIINAAPFEPMFYEISPFIFILFIFKKHLPFFHKLHKLMGWYRFISYLNIQNQQGKTFYQSILSAQSLFKEHYIFPVLQLIEEQLRFGQMINITIPKYLPCILHQTFCHHMSNNLQRCQEILEIEIKRQCKKTEQIIQPLMLLCLAGLCFGLITLVYQPIIKIGQYF